MKSETLEALQGSIQKWQDVVDGTGVDDGRANCPLCGLYNHDYNRCEECPANRCCNDTPFEEWDDHQDKIHASRHPYKIFPGCSECERLAKAEVEYLKSLLPVEKQKEKTTMRRIEIYEKKEVVVEGEPIRVKFTQDEDSIRATAVDGNGKRKRSGYLFILSLGGIYLNSGIDHGLGFDLDGNGKIKIQN